MNIRSKTLDKLTFFALFLVMIIPLEVWAQEGGNAATKAEKVPPASEIVSGEKKDAEIEEMDKADDPAKVNFSRSSGAVLAALENREKLEEAKGGNKLQFLLALGEWDGLREAFLAMEKDKAKAFYTKMLTDLQKQAAAKQNNNINKDAAILGQDDLIALTDCSPINPGEVMDPLAALYGAVLKDDPDMTLIVERFENGIRQMGGEDQAKRSLVADLLIKLDKIEEAQPFLLDVEKSKEQKDFQTLMKHIQAYMAKARRTGDSAIAFKAWDIQQWIARNAPESSRLQNTALENTLSALPYLPGEDGKKWLSDRFKDDPLLAKGILVRVGNAILEGLGTAPSAQRRDNLNMMRMAVDALFAADIDDLKPWNSHLTILAWQWSEEANNSLVKYQQVPEHYRRNLERQPPGSEYHERVKKQLQQHLKRLNFIAFEDLEKSRPTEKWLEHVDKTVLVDVRLALVRVMLQADKQQEVLDHLELLAKTHPEVCAGIAGEILTKWSTAVRPQVQQNNQVNLGIPLTRAQQKRNIRNLADLSKRLRSLPGDPIDPQDLVNAFASCHSPAEVFKIEDIELVLGPVGSLGDETVIALVTAMQSRLADSWRDPETQSNNMTNRTVKESEEEVKRGYRLAVDIMKRCLPRYEDDPSFLTKLGGVLYDAAEYDYSLNSKLSEYTEKRDAAFAYYRRAAQKYGESVSELQPFEYKADAYLRWYFATLGASDPSYLTAQQEYSHQRLEDIRLSIRELGESAADTHFSILGKQLAATYSRVPSQVKYRYLETSLMLLGNHPSGQEIDQIKTRYDELLDEIRLHAEVDGDTDVGHTQDFGLKISIVHTPEIAREGGGFAKYLTSANTRNYQLQRAFGQMSLRDNFEENIEKALNDTFNVKFITFCEPSVQARETGEGDWYETPMAYVQLQANDARIDQIPPIQMDLHFVDQGGAVVLPIESQLVMINARPEAVPPGDIPQLEITEILDERELDEGKMTLEIQATARGIIPDFDSLFKTEWGKTQMVNVVDQGMQVTRIESDDDKFQPVVERAWIVDLEQPVEMSTTANFNFPQPTIEVKELAYKRYDDADLADAESVIKLHMPGSGISVMGVLFFVVPGVLVLALLIALIVYLRRAGGAEVEDEHDYHMPSRLTPFTLTHLLRRIQADQTLALATERREELMGEIEQIERGYFAPSSESDGVELEPLARKWVHEARTHRP